MTRTPELLAEGSMIRRCIVRQQLEPDRATKLVEFGMGYDSGEMIARKPFPL